MEFLSCYQNSVEKLKTVEFAEPDTILVVWS